MRTKTNGLRFAVIGIDHRHIYHLIAGLQDAGAHCVGFVDTNRSDPRVATGLRERFPDLTEATDTRRYLEDASINLIVSAAIPAQRAAIAVQAMAHGKDVLVDKPGVTNAAQLQQVTDAVLRSGRIFSICFSERHMVPAVQEALERVRQGAIGRPIHTMGVGPHRLNAAIRPGWFFDTESHGGILVDIASHQIDQFLVFTGASDARIAHSHAGHYGDVGAVDFQDFGEIVLESSGCRGYIRVDWFTPDGLPTWGDGRLFITGTEGSIEIRKYIDVQGRPGSDHLLMVDRAGTRYLDCSSVQLDFFAKLVFDIQHRTETAMEQRHVFTVCRLALDAQVKAVAAQLR